MPGQVCWRFLPGQQEMMDWLEWIPYSLLHICQQHDIDILLGIVPNHRAHSSVDSPFLREQDVPALAHRELQPIAIHLPPLLADMVKHLRSKECLHGWSREQVTCLQLAQKPVQVARGDVRAT